GAPRQSPGGRRRNSREKGKLLVRIRMGDRSQPPVVTAELQLMAALDRRQIVNDVDLALLVCRGVALGELARPTDDHFEKAVRGREAGWIKQISGKRRRSA